MQRLLLIEVAVCAALIMVTALVMVRRWRRHRSHRSVPGRERSAAPAAPTGAGLAGHPPAVVPGFADDAIMSGAGTPSGPGMSASASTPSGPGALVPAGPERAAGRAVRDVAGPEPHLNGPARTPDEQQSAADATTSSARISSYYEEADRLMSDYLAGLGWAQNPGTQDPRSDGPGASAE